MTLIPRHFRTQLLVAFVVFVAVPLVLVVALVYERSATVVRQEVERSASSALEQAGSFVEYQMRYLYQLTELVTLNRNLREILRQRPPDVPLSGQLDQYWLLSKHLGTLQSSEGAYRIRLYMDDRWFYSRERSNLYGLDEFSDLEVDDEAFAGRQTVTLPERTYRYFFDEVREVLTLIRPIYATGNVTEIVAIVAVDTLSANMKGVLHDLLRPYGGTASLIDQSDTTLLEIGESPPGSSEVDFYRIESTLSSLNWTLRIQTPNRRIFASLLTFRRFVVFTAVAVVAAFTALSMLLSFLLSRRVTSIVESIRAVRSGSLSTRAEIVANDEIGLIEAEFNTMLHRIGELLTQVEEDGIAIRDAELRALQSQINPHFLYNTLDLIGWKSLRHQATDIHELVIAMARFYKVSLASGRDIVTIDAEREHAELYVRIENMRFDESVTIHFDVADRFSRCELPKITLQPLVENSIHHGIFESGAKTGNVWIRASQRNGMLHLDVIDDGETFITQPGWFDPAQLGVFSQGFGIRNIHARLQAHFGPDAGLCFSRRANGGTIARIIVPERLSSI